jgi:hypothetical protein
VFAHNCIFEFQLSHVQEKKLVVLISCSSFAHMWFGLHSFFKLSKLGTMFFGPFSFQDALVGLLLAIHIPLLTSWMGQYQSPPYLP